MVAFEVVEQDNMVDVDREQYSPFEALDTSHLVGMALADARLVG